MNEQLHLFDWFTKLVNDVFEFRGFKATIETERQLQAIFNEIEIDKKFSRTKAETWLKYGEFPFIRKTIILQDFYPTVDQLAKVTEGRNLHVLTTEELVRKCMAYRSKYETDLVIENLELKDQLVKIDHNAQLHVAFKQIIDLQFKNSELLTTLDRMKRELQHRDAHIERLQNKLTLEQNKEKWVDCSEQQSLNSIDNIVTSTAERMHL